MDLGRIIQAFEQGGTPVVRTDFSDDESWELVVYELTKPDDDGVEAHVTPVEDRALAGVTGDVLGGAFDGQGMSYGYVVLADARSMAEAAAGVDLTVDYVDLSVADDEDAELFESFPGNTFRCAALSSRPSRSTCRWATGTSSSSPTTSQRTESSEVSRRRRRPNY